MSGPPKISKSVIRFAVSGVATTLLFVAAAYLFIEIGSLSSVGGNVLAFALANTFSYCVNTLWSFSSSVGYGTFVRFLVVSLIGLAITAVAAGTAQALGLHYWFGIALVVCTVPPATYLLHRNWTYR